ncbi:ORF 73 ECLF1 [Aquipluma nitroreducens]|uniref:ORF 73 ECLF1 n=1 Tax=Aquipluma nitroreducens TaxID=2010828 RepID=A0A5K7S6F2_9BACT|nr:DUF2231 domain-containing protein [Aquipluma nitroreducens]BBE17128.1 ORF 73 ECLF1 [Aquipluma nitroreducens]
MISATHLHAMIIHFPIALLMAGFLSEVIALFIKKEFFSQAAFYLLILGALGATAAYLTGGYAGEGIEEGPLKNPMELHEEAAAITLWLAIITALFRAVIFYFKYNRFWVKWLGIILFTALVGSVARTGYLGGQLVYSHGAGVQLALPDFGNTGNED